MAVTNPDWTEHAVSIVILSGGIIAILITLAAGLARQVFKQLLDAIQQLNETIGKMFAKFDNHEHRLSILEGSHRARTEAKITCKIE